MNTHYLTTFATSEIRASIREKISKFISDLKLFIEKKTLVSADELIWFYIIIQDIIIMSDF